MKIILYYVHIPYSVDCDATRSPIGDPFTYEYTSSTEFLNPLVTPVRNVDDVRGVDSEGFGKFELPVIGSYRSPIKYE